MSRARDSRLKDINKETEPSARSISGTVRCTETHSTGKYPQDIAIEIIDEDELKEIPSSSEPKTSWRPGPAIAPVATYGAYEILGRLARGGMAEIFLAREHFESGSTRHVVIKRVIPHIAKGDPQFVQMFLDEARLTMGLRHRNHVTSTI